MGKLTAKVQIMLRGQSAVVLGGIESGDGVFDEITGLPGEIAIDANTNGVQHGCDAGSANHGVVRVKRHQSRPAGRPGADMLFQVVGVQLHQASREQSTFEVDGGGKGADAGLDIGDQTVLDDRGSRDHLAIEHDAAIGQNHHE